MRTELRGDRWEAGRRQISRGLRYIVGIKEWQN